MAGGFRFGLTLFPVMEERRAWTDLVRQAEAGGFGAITVIDHFGSSGGIFASLVSAAAAAPSLRVGTLVLNNDFWNPCLLAREVITADVLTDGRFELGLGAGWDESDYRVMGMVREPGPRRLARLAEAIQIIRQALDGGPVRFEGDFYSVETGTWPRPTQDRVPLLIGGGSRRILELAGRNADIVSIHRRLEHGVAASWASETASADGRDRIAEKVGWVRAAAGSRFHSLQLHALIQRVVVTDRRREAAAELGDPLGLRAEDVLASPHFLVGAVDEIVDDLIERRQRWGIGYWTLVGTRDLDAFAPVVARLAAA